MQTILLYSAAGNDAAAGGHLFGFHGSGHPDRIDQRHSERAGAVRLRKQFHSHAAGNRARRALPFPYGGKQRQYPVDLDSQALQSKGLSPVDIVNAVNSQNLILPTGTAKLGTLEYTVEMNGSPQTVAELNDLPDQNRKRRDHLHARRRPHSRRLFSADQHRSRQRSARRADGGLQNRQRLDARHRQARQSKRCRSYSVVAARRPAPDDVLRPVGVRARVHPRRAARSADRGVSDGDHDPALPRQLEEHADHRHVSIPLSILVSVLLLSALHETINIMTLGGLALAVGILVDDATVEIENINRNLAMGKETVQAILDGAQQIAVPAFVSTLCICIVFLPMFFLSGRRAVSVRAAGRSGLVRHAGLVHVVAHDRADHGDVSVELRGRVHPRRTSRRETGIFPAATSKDSNSASRELREGYRSALGSALDTIYSLLGLLSGISAYSRGGLIFVLGRDFFPKVDAGQIRLHFRARTGLRIEETARLADQIDGVIREIIPSKELRNHPRQSRRALQRHQPELQQLRHVSAPPTAKSSCSSRKSAGPTTDYINEMRGKAAASVSPAFSSSSSPPTSSRRF